MLYENGLPAIFDHFDEPLNVAGNRDRKYAENYTR